MEDQKRRYNGEYKIRIDTYNQFKEKVEKEFIIDFLQNLPMDKLKELIKFKTINPFIEKDYYTIYELDRDAYLRSEFSVQLNAEILL